MGYFNMTYYDSLMHSETRRDLNGTSISDEKGTDNKANNTSAYNHEYYMRHKDKWKDNTNTIKEISGFTGMKEEAIQELKNLAKEKGLDSDEYKKLLSELSEGDSAQAKKIEDTLKKDLESSEKEFDLDAAALDVIRGKYKNGAERKAALGDDYEMVQKRVNEMMKNGVGKSGSSSSSSTPAPANTSSTSNTSSTASTGNAWYNNYANKVAEAQEQKAAKEQEKRKDQQK